MAMLYAVGTKLVPAAELAYKGQIGALNGLIDMKAPTTPIEFTSGSVTPEDIKDAAENQAVPFTPIGMGKPLSIQFLTAYTGDAPGRTFLDKIVGKGKPDLLVTSAVKNALTFGAAPRAINQVIEDIGDNQLYRPGALREGSPIIFYSPAMTESTSYVSVELVADSFSGDIFTHLKNLFSTAAELPVFAPAAAFLMAGSVISKIAGNLAKAFLETTPFLVADEDIQFQTPGVPPDVARFLVFANDRDESELKKCEVRVVTNGGDSRVLLVDQQSGEDYRGKMPYVVAAVNGAEKKEWEKFTPQHVTAAMLDKFYGDPKGRSASVVGGLQDAISLYNDLKFRQQAEQYKKELASLVDGSDEYKRTEELLAACVKNIRNEALQTGLLK